MQIEKLLHSLSIQEKIGQLLQIAPFFFIKDLEIEVAGQVRDLKLTEKSIFAAGSVLGIHNASEMMLIQKKYLEKSRHKIPLMFMADIIHGYETIFPVPIALASSFNPKLAYQTARISAIEASTAGIHVTFSPMADLTRDPRWGRVVEGFGEDPYLASVFVSEMVKGYQGTGIEKDGQIASCVKHFAAYGASEAGRDYNTVNISRNSLHNDYLKSYRAAVDAGARLIMTSFNVVDGIPSTINTYLLRDILRKKWHFEGVTVTDYDSLRQVIDHGCAEDEKEAAYRGMLAGLDIEIASTCYQHHLEELITSKQIDMSLLDDAVRRVLILKRDIGLFENPYKGAQVDDERMLVRSKSHLDSSLKIAHESAVLLKNDHILPLDRKMTIALIGPYAKSKSTHGPWSWKGDINLNQTLEDALDNAGVHLVFLKSAIHEGELTVEDLDKMSKADVVIVAAGEQAKQSGEAHSRSDIHLPNKQNTLVKVAKRLNKPVVLILFNGRPLILDHVMEADAILETWFLGSRSSEAIVDLLYGNVNPSGKLPMSFPRNVGQVPVYYNHLNTGRPIVKEAYNEFVTRYLDVENTPLFPFGYGLSYANFVYKDFNLDKTEMELDQTINVSVSISNDSQIAGYETVQLYIRDYVAHTARPVKELKKFQKIWIEPNMYKTVQFQIGLEDLMYQDDQGNPIYEIGRFAVMVGPDSEKVMSADFVLKEAKK